MSLVTSKEISSVLHLEKYGFLGILISWILLKILRITKLNKIYSKHIRAGASRDYSCFARKQQNNRSNNTRSIRRYR